MLKIKKVGPPPKSVTSSVLRRMKEGRLATFSKEANVRRKAAQKKLTEKALEEETTAQAFRDRLESERNDAIKRIEIKRSSRIDWVALKETWMRAHMNNESMSLEEAGKMYGASKSTVWNRSSQERWAEELAFRIKNRDDIVGEAIKARSEEAMARLQEDYVTNEAEIRKRHAMIARGVQAKAVRRLQAVKIEDMKVSDAISLLKLGLDEERRALGLAEVYDPTGGTAAGNTLPAEYKPLTLQFAEHKKTQELGVELLKRLQSIARARSPTEVSDAVILDAVGLGPDIGEK